jgi:hypothetical protein
MTVIVPMVHSNGTSKEELMQQLLDAHHALTEALGAMGRASPHGRDYYVMGNETLTKAGDDHRARIAKLVEVIEEIEEIAQGVIAQ